MENVRRFLDVQFWIVSTCLGRFYDWQQVLWKSGHCPSFQSLSHPHSPCVLPSSTGFEDLLATVHMVQTPHLPHILQGLLLLKFVTFSNYGKCKTIESVFIPAPHSSSQPARPPSHSSPSLSGAVANISLCKSLMRHSNDRGRKVPEYLGWVAALCPGSRGP